MAADPEFAFKVGVEQVIGVGAAVSGDMLSRPNYGLDQLDFVFSTLIVGSLMNFALMYLLAATTGAPPTGLVTRFVTGDLLRSLGAPTGHIFEQGAYGLGARLTTFVYKAAQFGFIGFGAGLAGTAMTQVLLAARKAADPTWSTQNEQPDVIKNAGCWALHMSVSSNVRYQSLNGLDMVLAPRLPSNVFRVLATTIRLANNVVGGISFSTIARVTGVQKASGAAATSEGNGKGKGKGKAPVKGVKAAAKGKGKAPAAKGKK